MNFRKLAETCRIMAETRDSSPADIRRMADSALAGIPEREARVMRAVADFRETPAAGRPYVARSASQRSRRGRLRFDSSQVLTYPGEHWQPTD